MKTIVEYSYFILAFLFGLLFTLLGFLYEIWQYKKNYNSTFPKIYRTCDHRFSFNEVMDSTINPKCVKCGEKLSEIKQ